VTFGDREERGMATVAEEEEEEEEEERLRRGGGGGIRAGRGYANGRRGGRIGGGQKDHKSPRRGGHGHRPSYAVTVVPHHHRNNNNARRTIRGKEVRSKKRKQ
jgi:hypothetical protein